MLEERVFPAERVEVLEDGSIQVREATVIIREGVADPSYPPRYHRYVLHPGDDLSGRDARITAVAAAAWTADVIGSWQAAENARVLPAGAAAFV
jgi:hypothetical protein